MLNNYKSILTEIKYKRNDLTRSIKKKDNELLSLKESFEDHKAVRDVFKQAAILTQKNLESNISSIVTKAIRLVFPEKKDIQFIVEFVERRDTVECDLYIREKGKEYNPLDSKGYGLADICSLGLRIAYILLDNVDNVLFLDEPFRNLHVKRQPLASKMLKEITDQFDMQIVVNTHIDELIKHADKVISVYQKDDISYVR